ncbi:TRAP transporter substrate-binding protein DctP [Chakrabartyella piscis]|uniref:TRAP transporter substrate-binding protein DctP n=1 Tax=Chakrabartyella piscis TaxID=2918914 RepID=UPI00295895C9|nr:TRAP transporter substrate-binding protein DctP [Chakrabartyella piscis]
MKFKKVIAAVMAATMVLSFVGCSSSSSSEAAAPAADSSAAATEEAAPAADAPATNLTVCGTNGVGDTQSMAHEELAARLNAMGGWNAKAMVSSEMGSTDDVLEQAIAGVGVIAASDPARIASYVPEIGILMMPYLFDSYDQLDTLMDTELYKGWTADLKDQGLVLLTNNCLTGWRNWVTNTAINEPADLSGIKIRTMGTPIALNSVNAMGAIATPLDQNEAYNGISTGVIDGGEWQLPTIYTLKLYEVASHISLSHHFLLTGSIVAGAAWYDQLSEEQQVQLSETAVETYKDNQAIVNEYEEKYLAEMQDTYGVTVTEPDREAFKAATAYLYSDMDTTGGVDFDALRTELYAQLGM